MLEGSHALVLGGGGDGIGRAITRAFAAAGSAVAVADVDRARAEEAASQVGGIALVADLTTRAEVNAVVGRAVAELGSLEILVTVVGGQLAFIPAARVHEIADDDWDLMFELNLRYVFHAVRAALRVFLGQRAPGTIVSVGSVTGSAANPGQAAYGAAKAGLASLARSVAVEYGGDGIRMNVVSCGAIATPVALAAGASATPGWVPMGRAGSPQEVADAAVFLASPRSSYISGHSVVLDGGASAAGPFAVARG